MKKSKDWFFETIINDNYLINYQPEELDYRIEKIVFENFKLFKDQQTIHFKTNSKLQANESTIEKKKWTASKEYKYPRILGFYGKNASGKTSILTIIRSYFGFLTACLNSSNKLEMYFPFDFYNSKKPIKFSIFYNTSKFDFEHQLEFFYDAQGLFRNDYITVHEIFNIQTNSQPKVSKLIFENSYKISEIENSFFSKEERKNNLNRDIVFEVQNENLKNFKTMKQKYVEIFKAIEKSDKNFYEKHYIYKMLKVILGSVSFAKAGSYQDFKNVYNSSIIPLAKINDKKQALDVLSKAASAIDANVEKLVVRYNRSIDLVKENVDFTTDVIDEPRNYLFAELKNGVEIPIEELSNGTLDFIIFVSYMLYESLNVPIPELHKYLLIDEIGNNWHPQLTQTYVNLFNEGIIENTTLVFTSHDPYLADGLRTDSIFIIDNNQNIKKLSNTLMSRGQKLRSNEKFSNRYLDFAFSHFNTNPDINDFGEFLDEYEEFQS